MARSLKKGPFVDAYLMNEPFFLLISLFKLCLFIQSKLNVFSYIKPLCTFSLFDYFFLLLSINLSLVLLPLVFLPRAGLPQGVTGDFLPIGDLPSPPPCG